MPSGSKKADYDPEQYEKQLQHSRDWKTANRERVRKYNREYRRERARLNGSQNGRASDSPS